MDVGFGFTVSRSKCHLPLNSDAEQEEKERDFPLDPYWRVASLYNTWIVKEL